MKTKKIAKAIEAGLEFLVSQQKKDGSFLSFSSNNENDFTSAITHQTNFLNAFILLETESFAESKKINLLRKKLANFLLSQKTNHWSWNYWIKSSIESKDFPYPDDLDDTFCALAALSVYDHKIIAGEVLASVVKNLTLAESKVGGPYKTWLVSGKSSKQWKDVDLAVNCNINFFLLSQDVKLPNLDKYFEQKLKRNEITSLYYPSFFEPLYFLSRFYSGRRKKNIIDIIMKARNENFSWGNPLKTSLALLTIFNFGFPIDYLQQSISYLLKTQKDGGWNAFAFCLDPAKNGEKFFAGASSLTTVFCLKTLNKYQQLLNKKQLDDLNNKESVYKKIIIKNVLNIFRNKNRLIYLKTKKILNKIIEKDSDNQITLLAYYFLYSCKLNVKKISKNIIIKLGVANTLGWLAYAIYDDFLDGEGDPAALPIANLALRHLTFIFDTFPQKSREVRDLFHFLLNKIEIANAWEIKNSRTKDKLPAYKSLKQVVNKSIGLAITPLVILVLLGYKRESKEFKNIYSYFYNFIIAKQLNDDGHDWEEDFNKKYITPVVALLLKKAKIKKIKLSKKNLHNLFWREVIIDVCALIYKYVKKAKRDLNNSGVIIKFGKLESFLDKHKNGADKAIEEQKRVKEFLKSYR